MRRLGNQLLFTSVTSQQGERVTHKGNLLYAVMMAKIKVLSSSLSHQNPSHLLSPKLVLVMVY